MIAIGRSVPVGYSLSRSVPVKSGRGGPCCSPASSGSLSFLSYLIYGFFGHVARRRLVRHCCRSPLRASGGRTPCCLPTAKGSAAFCARPFRIRLRTRAGIGRACLLFVGFGMFLAGSVMVILGSTVVFVPQDITYLGFAPPKLSAINPHLIPLIAHDRAGFGGRSCLLRPGRPADPLEIAPVARTVASAARRRTDRLRLRHRHPLPHALPQRLPPCTGVRRRRIYAIGIACLYPSRGSEPI